MKVALYSRTDSHKIQSICEILSSLSIDYVVNPKAIDDYQFDLAASLGGDGTFLYAARSISATQSRDSLPLIGINSGRVGFLATVNFEDCRAAFMALVERKQTIEERTMIELSGIDCGSSNIALNEITIQRKAAAMIKIEIKIDQSQVASYWADGVIVSTPTGSTAYSMSVGGAILSPGAQCFIISPVAAHNLSLRPLVIPDTSQIEISIHSRNGEGAIATVDNSGYEIEDGEKLYLTRSSKTLKIININNTSFYNTLREKLHWGVDIRK